MRHTRLWLEVCLAIIPLLSEYIGSRLRNHLLISAKAIKRQNRIQQIGPNVDANNHRPKIDKVPRHIHSPQILPSITRNKQHDLLGFPGTLGD